MADIHEPRERLSASTLELHRAINSLIEELDAIDWYQQRVDASDDEALRAILAHNRDEEIEHAAMVLEWIRRHQPTFDRILRTYLFREGDVTALEETAGARDAPAPGEPFAGARDVPAPGEPFAGAPRVPGPPPIGTLRPRPPSRGDGGR